MSRSCYIRSVLNVSSSVLTAPLSARRWANEAVDATQEDTKISTGEGGLAVIVIISAGVEEAAGVEEGAQGEGTQASGLGLRCSTSVSCPSSCRRTRTCWVAKPSRTTREKLGKTTRTLTSSQSMGMRTISREPRAKASDRTRGLNQIVRQKRWGTLSVSQQMSRNASAENSSRRKKRARGIGHSRKSATRTRSGTSQCVSSSSPRTRCTTPTGRQPLRRKKISRRRFEMDSQPFAARRRG